MNIVFMGTPDFAVPALRALHKADDVRLSAVFTQPDKPRGRGMQTGFSAVKTAALEMNLPIFQPANLRDFDRAAFPDHIDAIAVVAYGKLLPRVVLDIAPCVNVHASLLPLLRGAAPIQWAVANGFTETGVTTMRMAEELDAGDILLQQSTPIGVTETAGELFDRLAPMGATLLLKTLRNLHQIQPTPQDPSRVTFAPIITKQTGQIDWTQPAAVVDCFIRGMHPWPCATAGALKIHKAAPIDRTSDQPPGTILDGGAVVCGNGNCLQLLELQAAGGKRMAVSDYLRGHNLSVNN